MQKTISNVFPGTNGNKTTIVLGSDYSPEPYLGIFIRPQCVVTRVCKDKDPFAPSYQCQASKDNLKKPKLTGKLTAGAKKRLSNAINWLCAAATEKNIYVKGQNKRVKFKVNFITLTMPDADTDVSGHFFKTKLLQPWLSYARQYLGLNLYVWKLERHKSGKLHCHMATDSFINFQTLQITWNKQLERNGLLSQFIEKFGHSNPPSTQIKATYAVEDMAAYIAKYCTDDKEAIEDKVGRLWGCCRELSATNKCILKIKKESGSDCLEPLMNPDIDYVPVKDVNKRTGMLQTVAEVFFLKSEDWVKRMFGPIKIAFEEHIMSLRYASRRQYRMYAS